MKTILAATDFSQASLAAVNYAAALSDAMGLKLVLCHVYHAPVMVSEVPVTMPSLEQVEQECLAKLGKIKDAIKGTMKSGNEPETLCTLGLAVDEIRQYVKKNPETLVVMGMSGGGYITEKIFGSVTTALMSKCECPVMAIGPDAKFKKPANIVLASDLKKTAKGVLKPLLDMARGFGTHIHVLNVYDNGEVPDTRQAVEGIKLDHQLDKVPHSFHYAEDSDITEAISRFAESKKMDMVAMISRKHNALDKLFREPSTKKMAFHTSTPLFILPDHEQ